MEMPRQTLVASAVAVVLKYALPLELTRVDAEEEVLEHAPLAQMHHSTRITPAPVL